MIKKEGRMFKKIKVNEVNKNHKIKIMKSNKLHKKNLEITKKVQENKNIQFNSKRPRVLATSPEKYASPVNV